MEKNSNVNKFKICRTCFKQIASPSLYLSVHSIQADLTIGEKLLKYVPEVDLSLTPNAVICCECAEIINTAYSFKTKCLQQEMEIHKYTLQRQCSGSVDLTEVAQVYQLHYEDLGTEIKTEAVEITENLKTEESATTICDSNETVINQNYLLSLQMVDIESVLFNVFENIDYGQPNIEENAKTCDGSSINSLPRGGYIQNHECYTCGYKTNSKLELISHIKKKHGKHQKKIVSKNAHGNKKNLLGRYKCLLCNYITTYKCLYSFHNRMHLTKKCYKHFAPSKSFYKQSKDTTNCNQNNTLKSSTRASMLEKPFLCSVCEYRCTYKSILKLHMQIHTQAKPFQCSACGFRCNQKGNLKSHIMRIHLQEKPFNCSACEFRCNQKGHLKNHMQTHSQEKPFKCSICEYRCNRKGSLKSHMQIHSQEKPFKCSICEYRYNRKDSLKLHMRIHSQEKLFKCSGCEYGCNQKGHLKSHMQTHSQEKPFKCSICEYRCNRKDSLKSHMQIHSQEKPFKCSICEYRYNRKDSLKSHMQTHSEERPIKCSVCEYRCKLKANLKSHMKLIH